jgi:hypothetical protein
MSAPIKLTPGLRRNLLSLQNAVLTLASMQSRLATGKPGTSEFDIPFSFFTSALVDDRASELDALFFPTPADALDLPVSRRLDSLSAAMDVGQARQGFTRSVIDILKTRTDRMALADSNADDASLLALRTRQQMAASALSLADQASQAELLIF